MPEGITIDGVRACLVSLPDVTDVHDLHTWATSMTEAALTAHLVIPGIADHDGVLGRACAELHDRFGIEPTTLQPESDNEAHPYARAVPGVI